MDELINEALRGTTVQGGLGLWEIVAALGLSFFLTMVVAYFYRETHRGLSYSVAFVHTMVLMGVTVSIIMLIIGSNIARAFALVGALSIIRFRNAVKESRDVAFIFITMAVGMAAGTGFYLAAVVFTVFICTVVFFLFRFDIGQAARSEVMVKVHLPEHMDYHHVFDEVFFRHLEDHALVSVETIRGGTMLELVYSVQFKRAASEVEFLNELRAVNANNKVALLTGQENVNV